MRRYLVKTVLAVCILVGTFSACSQEDEVTYRLNTKLVELNCKGTLALEVSPALQGLSYTSLNTTIATVSADGLIEAKLVGATKVVVKDSLNRFIDTVKVVVRSVNTLFDDPYLGFGADSTTVKNNVSLPYYGKNIFSSLNFELVFGEDDNSLHSWTYRFDKDGRYTYSYMGFYILDYYYLSNHINDRYSYMAYKTTDFHYTMVTFFYYYINPDSTLIVLEKHPTYIKYKYIEYHPATKETIQRILSDEEGNVLE